jgi:hypothetical protein
MEGQGSPSALKKPPPLYFYNFYRGLSGIYLDYLESLTRGFKGVDAHISSEYLRVSMTKRWVLHLE